MSKEEPLAYGIAREPAGDRYRQLIDVGLRHGDKLLLVLRNELRLGDRGAEVLAKLKRHLIEITHESEWPGTELVGHTAVVHRFRFDFTSAEVLKESANRLYEWVQPERPEDLCILRSDGSPWLVSITHERWAHLMLTEDEAEEFKREAPLLAKSLRDDIYPFDR